MLKTGSASGNISDHMESINPVFLTIIYVGINPALKSMVTTKNHEKILRALNSPFDLERGYATRMINSRLIGTPIAVRISETNRDVENFDVFVINSYETVVKPIGKKVTSPPATAVLSENDIASRLIKGAMHRSETSSRKTILDTTNILRGRDSFILIILILH